MTYIEDLKAKYGIGSEEETNSTIPLKGDKLEAWRTRQTKAYQNSGLTEDQAKELLQFVEWPADLPTEGREIFNTLADKAINGGYVSHLEKSVQAPGL